MARQIALLAGRCEFFTALGDDELGRRSERRLAELGVDVHAVRFGESRARAWVHVDDAGERTITTLGAKLLPRGPLPLKGYDAVFFVSGDVEALRSARAARFLAATARELPTLQAAGVRLDLLDRQREGPRRAVRRLALDVATVVRTEGRARRDGERRARTRRRRCPARSSTPTARATRSAATLCFALARGDDAARRARPRDAGGRRGRDRGAGPYTLAASA